MINADIFDHWKTVSECWSWQDILYKVKAASNSKMSVLKKNGAFFINIMIDSVR